MTSVAASSSSPSSSSPSSSSIVVLHIDTSDMRPILKEAFGKNVEIATISSNGSIPAKYFYEGLQNYVEGIVANHGGGGDDDEDAQRTADGVTAIKKNIGIILKEILNDNLRTALTPFDRDGDGTIDAEELQQAAKDHQTVLMSRKILAWFSFALFLFMIIVCGGLSVGIYYIVFSMKDTYVNPSTGLMMVKAPGGSTNSNTAGIGIKLPTKTVGQGVTIPSQGTMDGRTCYSSDSVANMFVNVATGVTTSLAETNQETDELHIYHLGNSDCDESNIVWSNKDVQLGCVVMVPSLECTNMVRRGRYLSEFADTDAMQDRHRSLKEHVANMIVGATTGGQHGTTIDRSNRNLEDDADDDIAYTNANDNGSEAAVTWKKYDATDCKGAHTRINDSKSFGGGQRKWQTEYTVEEMLAECKSKCAEDKACVAFNFRDNREHEDYPFGGSSCKWWSTITDTPNAVGDSKDCWVSSKANFGQTPNPTPEPTESPTANPTLVLTFVPSSKPSGGPSGGPSNSPSSSSSSSPSTNPTPVPTVAPTTQPPTASTTSPTTSPTKSPTKSPTNSLLIIAENDEEFENLNEENDSLRETCNKLSVQKDNACAQVPVDCVNGYVRGTDVTCQKACDGQCCASTDDRASFAPCQGFTGLVHRDGSCSGSANSCRDATIGEVKGPSCTGIRACKGAKISRVTESCNAERTASNYVTGFSCERAEVDVIQGSCNKLGLEEDYTRVDPRNTCYYTFAASIIDGEVSGEFDPREICRDKCKSSEERSVEAYEAYIDCLYRCDDLY